ncbi:hypothetical protein F2Q68_00034070 [Brassica cretica]|uniref:Uncharacterized protein n=1 Tax=Brassica cretica TaxID=69181 RepID=A0A8S9H4Z3_BRACR|nr:hypothetical protein F2Q68_00034070 [Brassica cretica]
MADKSRGKYLSLRQYEGPFQVPRIYTIPTPDDDRYTIEEVMKIMKKAMSDKDKMYNKMQQTIVRIMTHEEFAARHPHPPQPYRVTTEDIDRQQQSATDRHQTLGNDR